MNGKVCENCKWYKYKNIATGDCIRFPKWVKNVAWSHYCGEWKGRNDD